MVDFFSEDTTSHAHTKQFISELCSDISEWGRAFAMMPIFSALRGKP